MFQDSSSDTCDVQQIDLLVLRLEQAIHGLEDALQTIDGTLEPVITFLTLLEFWVQACRYHHSLIACSKFEQLLDYFPTY